MSLALLRKPEEMRLSIVEEGEGGEMVGMVVVGSRDQYLAPVRRLD